MMDITVDTQVETLVQEAVRIGDRLDVMVDNAGMGGTESQGPV